MSLLSVKDVCKAFGEKPRCSRGSPLRCARGKCCPIIGPSGSGKSTLLRCLTLLERVDTGCIAYEDLTMVSMAAGERANRCVYSPGPVLQQIRRRFGLVFQNFNLFPHMSVMQNLTEAPVRVAGRSKDGGPPGGDGPAREGGAFRQGGRVSLRVVRRAAAAGGHCPGAGHASGYPVFRRTHLRPGSRS